MEGWKQANGVEDDKPEKITFEDEVGLKRMMAAEIRKEKREQREREQAGKPK